MKSIDNWKRAIINLQFGNKNTNSCNRPTGTAVFIKYNDKKFLITAAHLLIGKSQNSEKSSLYDNLYDYAIRIPSFDELNDEDKRKKLSKKVRLINGNLSVYLSDPTGKAPGNYLIMPKYLLISESKNEKICAVTLSANNDLAVISLRPRSPEALATTYHFAQELEAMGYQSISIEDIGNSPSQEGADIFTIGYPSGISLINQRLEEIGDDYDKWSSADITLPITAFGKISMINNNLDYFWADVRVYPGNSGSPVIENDKLIGIVTNMGVVKWDEKESGPNEYIAVPFAKATKAQFIKKLLDEQIQRDNEFVNAILQRRIEYSVESTMEVIRDVHS